MRLIYINVLTSQHYTRCFRTLKAVKKPAGETSAHWVGVGLTAGNSCFSPNLKLGLLASFAGRTTKSQVGLDKIYIATAPTLTAPAAVHVDLRTLHRRDDPLCLPRSRSADTVQLLLQNRPGFGHSGVSPSWGREGPQDATSRFN